MSTHHTLKSQVEQSRVVYLHPYCSPYVFFYLMLHVAFKDTAQGVDIKSRCDIGLGTINTKHLNAATKVTLSTIRDLLFADDAALAACTEEDLQHLCDCFSRASRRFGLSISIKKKEVLYQPARGQG